MAWLPLPAMSTPPGNFRRRLYYEARRHRSGGRSEPRPRPRAAPPRPSSTGCSAGKTAGGSWKRIAGYLSTEILAGYLSREKLAGYLSREILDGYLSKEIILDECFNTPHTLQLHITKFVLMITEGMPGASQVLLFMTFQSNFTVSTVTEKKKDIFVVL